MNNENINSKIKLSNIFRHFDIRNFQIPKYWSFYIPSFQILTPTQKLANFKIVCPFDVNYFFYFSNCLILNFFKFFKFNNLKYLFTQKIIYLWQFGKLANFFFHKPRENRI